VRPPGRFTYHPLTSTKELLLCIIQLPWVTRLVDKHI
jgi:hypothetical protein